MQLTAVYDFFFKPLAEQKREVEQLMKIDGGVCVCVVCLLMTRRQQFRLLTDGRQGAVHNPVNKLHLHWKRDVHTYEDPASQIHTLYL